MPKPDLKQFLNDPKHAEDRDFMQGVFNHFLEKKVKEEEERKKKGEPNLFDVLFGGEE